MELELVMERQRQQAEQAEQGWDDANGLAAGADVPNPGDGALLLAPKVNVEAGFEAAGEAAAAEVPKPDVPLEDAGAPKVNPDVVPLA